VHDGEGAFAVSTRHRCKLIGKCKSSINAGFQAVGYTTTPMSAAHAASLVQVFPFMRSNCGEMRQWTIRATTFGSPRISFETAPLVSSALEAREQIDPLADPGPVVAPECAGGFAFALSEAEESGGLGRDEFGWDTSRGIGWRTDFIDFNGFPTF
jgi:hypothetical protein